jgi:hypothetical protein
MKSRILENVHSVQETFYFFRLIMKKGRNRFRNISNVPVDYDKKKYKIVG